MKSTPHPTRFFQSPSNSKNWLGLAIALLVFASAFRVVRVMALPEWPNFSPVMAIAFCGAWFLPGMLAVSLPLMVLLISDIALSAFYGVFQPGIGDWVRYACYAGAALAGIGLRRSGAGAWGFLGGVLGSAVAFYLITNTLAWAGNVAYPQSFGGWMQALTIGLPGYPPTWTFFRNSLVSDFIFAGLFVATAYLAHVRQKSPVPA